MTAKKYFHDLDLQNILQLIGARFQNVDNADESTLAGALGENNKGLMIFNTEEQLAGADAPGVFKVWNGSAFVAQALNVDGDVVFKGAYDASLAIDDIGQPQTIEAVAGYQYVVTVAGTFNAGTSGVTLQGNQEFKPGDMLIFTSASEAYAIQRNIDAASETVAGLIELATQAEVSAGDAARAVTGATLAGHLASINACRGYFEPGVDLVALTPKTVTHNLNLTDKDAFTIRVSDSSGSDVSVDVDSVDINSLTLTSVVGVTGLRVTVTGF